MANEGLSIKCVLSSFCTTPVSRFTLLPVLVAVRHRVSFPAQPSPSPATPRPRRDPPPGPRGLSAGPPTERTAWAAAGPPRKRGGRAAMRTARVRSGGGGRVMCGRGQAGRRRGAAATCTRSRLPCRAGEGGEGSGQRCRIDGVICFRMATKAIAAKG